MLVQADIFHLPFRDNSVDLIFTDPPYAKKYLPIYESLGIEAMRVLKQEAFLLVMCGGSYLDQVFNLLGKSGLTYFWKYEMYLTGQGAGFLWPRGNTRVPIVNRSKPIIAYSKGNGLPRTGTLGVFTSNGADKRYHHWGQDVASARYFIDCFSKEGDLVVDPMVGGGTTGVAATLIGRRFIGCDLDFDSCKTSFGRLVSGEIITPLPLFNMEDK